ncbi:MAG: diacylglycerol kinase [Planctomycetota bacterium]|jgi:diacylglycerol kinase
MRSFIHAFRGVATLIRTQRNAQVHAVAAGLVVAAGFALEVSSSEWCVLVLAIGCVVSAEAMNTGIEFVCDALHPEQHPMIGQAKDVGAAGVLIMALAAAVVGLLVFLPHIS